MLKVKIERTEELRRYGLDEEKLVDFLRAMLRIRKFEEKVEELFLVKGQLMGPAHLCFGHEAIAVGVIKALNVGEDVILSTHRGHGHGIAAGIPFKDLMAELFGKEAGTCKGLGGSMHVSIYPELGCLYASAIVGSNIPIAVGVGLALKRMGKSAIACCFFGDGAVTTSAFHEGLSLARFLGVPVLFVCENNQYAISMRVDKAMSGGSISDRVAGGYGIGASSVDGTDVLAVWRAAMEALKLVRGGDPAFIEAITYRLKGHGVYDRAEYRPKEEVEEWSGRDPIPRFKRELISLGVISEPQISAIEGEIERELEDAVSFAAGGSALRFEDLGKFV